LYPATISASASGKSKGALLVSANIHINRIIAQGNNKKKLIQFLVWKKIISVKFNEPVSIITGSKHKLIDIS